MVRRTRITRGGHSEESQSRLPEESQSRLPEESQSLLPDKEKYKLRFLLKPKPNTTTLKPRTKIPPPVSNWTPAINVIDSDLVEIGKHPYNPPEFIHINDGALIDPNDLMSGCYLFAIREYKCELTGTYCAATRSFSCENIVSTDPLNICNQLTCNPALYKVAYSKSALLDETNDIIPGSFVLHLKLIRPEGGHFIIMDPPEILSSSCSPSNNAPCDEPVREYMIPEFESPAVPPPRPHPPRIGNAAVPPHRPPREFVSAAHIARTLYARIVSWRGAQYDAKVFINPLRDRLFEVMVGTEKQYPMFYYAPPIISPNIGYAFWLRIESEFRYIGSHRPPPISNPTHASGGGMVAPLLLYKGYRYRVRVGRRGRSLRRYIATKHEGDVSLAAALRWGRKNAQVQ